jgi:hypothetical protein
MSSERKVVGFDRKLELSWLDATAAQVASGATADELHAYLWKMLDGSVSAGSSGFNSDRGKTITVLKRIWCLVPDRFVSLRDRALPMLQDVKPDERLAVHWSMCMVAYPFFFDVASAVGRLLSLQGAVQTSEVRRRAAEIWGDRVITRNGSQRILRCFVAWGALRDAGPRGTYEAAEARIVVSGPSAELLVEALLLRTGRPVPVAQVSSHPALFPFRLEAPPAELTSSSKFVLDRQGVDMDMLRLADGER